jgi:phosphoribosylaminoimidazolecarboxamide formyltransferase/IMP cyclohydrolase
MLQLSFTRGGDLRYGENPHQKAAVYSDPASAGANLVTAPLLHGKPLSYNNIADGSAAMQLVQDLHEAFPGQPAAAIIKHTNACGAAVAGTAAEAFDRARAGDPLAAFGGVLAINAPIDDDAAARIAAADNFLEVIVAPAYTDGAIATLGDRWANVRLLAVSDMTVTTGGRTLDLRSVPGGVLVQDSDSKLTSVKRWSHVAGPAPDDRRLDDAAFAWTVVKHLKSNAIAIAHDRALLGAGPGQVDRVQASRIAIDKAGDRLAAASGSSRAPVAASDAFFPFADGPEALIDAGVRCIVQPGGSKRDSETIDLCAKRDVTLLMTGVRHFRH